MVVPEPVVTRGAYGVARVSPETVPEVEILVEVLVSVFLDDECLSLLELEMKETTKAELESRMILHELLRPLLQGSSVGSLLED